MTVLAVALLITKPYMLAMTAGLVEYGVEAMLLPAIKHQWQWVSCLGLVALIMGEVIRKTAMVGYGTMYHCRSSRP